MNEQLRRLLMQEFVANHRCGDLIIGDIMDDKDARCDFCAFAADKKNCGCPWSPAEVLQGHFDPCYEGVSFAVTGVPETHLNELLLSGKQVPFLRLCRLESDPQNMEVPCLDAVADENLPF